MYMCILEVYSFCGRYYAMLEGKIIVGGELIDWAHLKRPRGVLDIYKVLLIAYLVLSEVVTQKCDSKTS